MIGLSVFIAGALCAGITASPPMAVSGAVSGTVRDPAGALVAGAQVQMRNEATGETRTVSTNEQGRFLLEAVEPGRYSLSVSSSGFKTAERTVVVTEGRTVQIEIKLEIAPTREEITVGP